MCKFILLEVKQLPNFDRLASDVYLYKDSVMCGVIKSGDDVLLIDCGDGLFLPNLDEIGAVNVKTALFTHYHADVCSGCWKLNAINTQVGVPELEKTYFSGIDDFFSSKESQYGRYNQNPSVNCIRKSVKVKFVINNGDEFSLSNINIKAIHTPAHTSGSMSYIVKSKNKTIAFVGDLLYDYGKVINLYSLQLASGLPTDYHGFMGAYAQLNQSLDKILEQNPNIIVPAHGNVITNPSKAIIEVKNHLAACYTLYQQISSINHWFGNSCFATEVNYINEDVMPLPSYVIERDTSRILISKDKCAFVIDCGTDDVVDMLQDMLQSGKIKSVDGVWVSHYHDDHVATINLLRETFGCPVYCHVCFSDVLENPNAYILPCLFEDSIAVDYHLKNFEDIVWKEFAMTNCYFPGQTIYHAALYVTKKDTDQTLLFAGDSFTPCGIDDYCSYNINPLKLSDGYFYCIDLIENLKPTFIINQHQTGGFVFSDLSIQKMRNNLMKRFESYSKLLPEGDVNYGLYPNWITSYPYCQTVDKGATFSVKFSVENYTNATDHYVFQIRLPIGLGNETKDFEMNITPNDTRHVSFNIKATKKIARGTHLIGLAVWKNNKFLGEQCHAKVVVE